MNEDRGAQMTARLRGDLRLAMKSRRDSEVALLRQLIAAIDNAQAAPERPERASLVRHDFHRGTAEVARQVLSEEQVRALIRAEIEKREQSAAEFERLGKAERASALRNEVVVAKRYAD